MTDQTTDDLSRALAGNVAMPGEEEYEDGRGVWNARFDRRPAIVVRCRTADDVRQAAAFARHRGLRIAVKAGGHSNAGHSAIDGGVLIDLSPMKGITVDRQAMACRVEPGVKWGELMAVLQRHGLATTGGTVSTVGVAGFTLGGGTGYSVRQHGMAIDNLLSADVVTADGRLVRANADENSDLYWGIRGGHGNFGVVTSFEFRLFELGPEVLAGQVMHRLEDAPTLLRSFREFMAIAPEDMQCYPFFLRIPPIDAFPEALHGEVVLDFVLFHASAGPAGEAALRPLVELGDPVLSMVGPQPFTSLLEAFDAGLPAGQRYGSRAHYLPAVTDEVIETIVAHAAGMVGAMSMAYLEPLGAAMGRVDPAATAFPHRDAAYGFHIMTGWSESKDDRAVTAWANGFHEAMAPHATGGVYVNLLAEDEQHRVRAAFGSNYERLVSLKRKWDPDNVFRDNYNIDPAG